MNAPHRLIFLSLGLLVCAGSSAGLEVRGRVLDHRGMGLKAHVEVVSLLSIHELGGKVGESVAGDPLVSGKTGEDGIFQLALEKPGFYRLRVDHPRYLAVGYDLAPVLEDLSLPEITLELGSEVLVRLMDELGNPLAETEMITRGWSKRWRSSGRDGWRLEDRWAKTAEDGTARVPCGGEERVSLAALARPFFFHQVVSCHSGSGVWELTPRRLRRTLLRHADGRPAAGVLGAFRWPLLSLGRSDASGWLETPCCARDLPSLLFADGGGIYGSEVLEGEGEQKEPWFELSMVEEVEGVVRDAFTEDVLSGAWVWLDRGLLHHTRSDSAGRFSLHWPEAEAPRLRAAAPGYLLSEGVDPKEEDTLWLVPVAKVRGQVVDQQGNPIGGARLRLVPVNADLAKAKRWASLSRAGLPQAVAGQPLEVKSDVDGRFEFQKIAPFVAYRLHVERYAFVDASQPVLPLQPGMSEEVEFVLEPARRVVGQVFQEDDQPLRGAEVELFAALEGVGGRIDFSRPESVYRGSTDKAGRFKIFDPPPAAYYLAARAEGYPELLIPGLEVPEDYWELDLGTLWLVPGLEVSGEVLNSSGEPLAGVELNLRKADGEQVVIARSGSVWFGKATTGADGRYRIGALPPDSHLTLLAHAEGYLPRVVPFLTTDIDLRLDIELPSPCALHGRVVDASGRGVGGAAVQVQTSGAEQWKNWAASDQDGQFVMQKLACGRFYEVVASAGDRTSEPHRQVLEAPQTYGLELRLEPRAVIWGQVFDQVGTPVRRARVSLAGADGSTSEVRVTGRDGRYHLRHLQPGVYRLKAEYRDSVPIEVEIEVLAGEETHQDFSFSETLPLEEWRVEGRVVDPQGIGVEGARVQLTEEKYQIARFTETDGSFRLQVHPGKYLFSVQHADFASYGISEFAVAGDLLGLEIPLSSGLTVRGKIHGMEAMAMAEVAVKAYGGLDTLYGTVRYDGAFRIDHLGSGEWTIVAERINPPRKTQVKVELFAENPEVVVDLHFEEGFDLSGLAYLAGELLPHAVVELFCSGYRGQTFSDSEGAFTLQDTPQGTCKVRLSDPRSGRLVEQQQEMVGDSWLVLEIPSQEP